MTVVIPYYLPPHGDHELRFALRSIERVAPDARVILIGQPPAWLRGVEVHPHEDRAELGRLGNVHRKLELATRLVPEFLLWNDDMLVLDPSERLDEYRTAGKLSNLAERLVGEYRRAAQATIERWGDGPSFEVHRPMLFLSEPLKKVLDSGPVQCYRTVYARVECLAGIETEDRVLRATFKVPSGWCASTDHMAGDSQFLTWVHREFPERSRFEG